MQEENVNPAFKGIVIGTILGGMMWVVIIKVAIAIFS